MEAQARPSKLVAGASRGSGLSEGGARKLWLPPSWSRGRGLATRGRTASVAGRSLRCCSPARGW